MNIEQKIDKLEQELIELKEQAKNCKPKYWKPESGKKAWFIYGSTIKSDFKWSSRMDKGLIAAGDVYQSQEEAEKELGLRLATQRLKEAIWEANGGKFVVFIPCARNYIINPYDNHLQVDSYTNTQTAQNWMYLKNTETAEKVLEKNHKDFETYYGLN